MKLYWREVRRGQRLVIGEGDGGDQEQEFVESFTPWDLFEGTQGLTVEADVLPFTP